MRGTKTIIERMDQADRINETDNQLKALVDVIAERDRLKAELDKAQAACAVMREALRQIDAVLPKKKGNE